MSEARRLSFGRMANCSTNANSCAESRESAYVRSLPVERVERTLDAGGDRRSNDQAGVCHSQQKNRAACPGHIVAALP
jgi:hypothetical protein